MQVGTEDKELMSKLTERCARYEITSGFEDCTFAIKYCVQNELFLKRQKQVIEIGQRIYELGAEAISFAVRRIISDYIFKPDNLAEQWDYILEVERLRPTMIKALAWKDTRVIFQHVEQNQFYMRIFGAALEEQFKESDLQTRSLEDDMLSDPDNKTSMELSHHPSEIRQREELCKKLIDCVGRVAQKLAYEIYNQSIVQFVRVLNESICEEDPHIFNTTLKEDSCRLELQALLKRVAVPIVWACLKWPHDLSESRTDAILTLARAAPWVAMKVCLKETNTPAFTKSVSSTLGLAGWLHQDGVNSLPKTFMKFMERVGA